MHERDSLPAIEATIDLYCSAWSCTDARVRLSTLGESMAKAGRYCDPSTDSLMGVDELDVHIAGVIERRPGSRVVRTGPVDVHHRYARFSWCVVLPDGSRLKEGSEDFVQLDTDGKLLLVVGFFGPGRSG